MHPKELKMMRRSLAGWTQPQWTNDYYEKNDPMMMRKRLAGLNLNDPIWPIEFSPLNRLGWNSNTQSGSPADSLKPENCAENVKTEKTTEQINGRVFIVHNYKLKRNNKDEVRKITNRKGGMWPNLMSFEITQTLNGAEDKGQKTKLVS